MKEKLLKNKNCFRQKKKKKLKNDNQSNKEKMIFNPNFLIIYFLNNNVA